MTAHTNYGRGLSRLYFDQKENMKDIIQRQWEKYLEDENRHL